MNTVKTCSGKHPIDFSKQIFGKILCENSWRERVGLPKGGRITSGTQDGESFSNFGNAGFIWSHGCASNVHTSTCGLNQLGSSKLAALIPTNWGTESGLTAI